MNVLIANANKDIIKGFLPKVEFTFNTTNTSTFSCGPKTFQKVYDKVKEKGYNPYSLMYW